jgi:hypothetical protein
MYESILIDDDPLVRMTWSMSAKSHGKAFKAFATPAEFQAIAPTIAPGTPIYIDSNLAGGIKGQDVAKALYEAGFKELYLATGYEPDSFSSMPWIKKIVGKDPPWTAQA